MTFHSLLIRAELFLEHALLQPPSYRPASRAEVLASLAGEIARDVAVHEAECAPLEAEVRGRIAALPEDSPLPTIHHADLAFARLCYAVCRALLPEVVVETGVAYGVTSSFFLAALERNGTGALHSVDRPTTEAAARLVGSFVPERLRPRWHLHRGASLDVLPRLLPELRKVQLFLHDSRHTWRNIRGELRAVQPFLDVGAVVMADDVERNRAWQDWAAANLRWSAVCAQDGKPGLVGLGVSAPAPR